MPVFEFKGRQSILFRIALGLSAVSMTIGLGLFAYLGTFTRYLADDYCETVIANSGAVLQNLIQRYETISDRYSNLLFVSMSEILFPHNVQMMPVVMIVLWVVALTWLVYESRRAIGLQWSFLLDFFLAASLAFFSILEAPNRFQTIYWRSAMATHFAPLVYLTAFTALVLKLIRRNENRFPAIWIGIVCLIIAFFGGGFSEPPDALMIVASALGLVLVWLLEKGPRRRPALPLLGWTLAGGLLALLTMFLAPGNSFRIRTARPGLLNLVFKTLLATYQFIVDSFSILPLPTIVSIVISLLLFYALFATVPVLSPENKRKLWIVTAAVPVFAFGLIVAAFAPSVYGQAFPAERARFIGQLLLVAGLMLEGACFGIVLSQWRMRWVSIASMAAIIVFGISAFYPLRAAWNVMQDKQHFYQLWSSVWDKRQKQILSEKANGIVNISVPVQLYSIEGIEELGANPDYWINRCAANYYGVQSISTR